MPSRLSMPFLLLVATQAVHSVEECAMRLYDVFAPAHWVSQVLGFPRPIGFTIANVAVVAAGLACWLFVIRPMRAPARALAYAWAALEIGNGCNHALLAARVGGYFPGVATAPLLWAAGLLLLFHLQSSE